MHLAKVDGSYGVHFVGPASEQSEVSGVFVTNMKENSPAAQSGLVKRGQQVGGVGLLSLDEALKSCKIHNLDANISNHTIPYHTIPYHTIPYCIC